MMPVMPAISRKLTVLPDPPGPDQLRRNREPRVRAEHVLAAPQLEAEVLDGLSLLDRRDHSVVRILEPASDRPRLLKGAMNSTGLWMDQTREGV